MKSLTSREREIVRILASGGLSNKDVGRRLNLSEGTVKVHLHNIYQKLGVKTRTALVVLAHTEFASASSRLDQQAKPGLSNCLADAVSNSGGLVGCSHEGSLVLTHRQAAAS
jgi:two-component system nitrate/nitrite response regulator NarL